MLTICGWRRGIGGLDSGKLDLSHFHNSAVKFYP